MLTITLTGETAKDIRAHVLDMAATLTSDHQATQILTPPTPQTKVRTAPNKAGQGRPAGAKNKNAKNKTKRGRKKKETVPVVEAVADDIPWEAESSVDTDNLLETTPVIEAQVTYDQVKAAVETYMNAKRTKGEDFIAPIKGVLKDFDDAKKISLLKVEEYGRFIARIENLS